MITIIPIILVRSHIVGIIMLMMMVMMMMMMTMMTIIIIIIIIITVMICNHFDLASSVHDVRANYRTYSATSRSRL